MKKCRLILVCVQGVETMKAVDEQRTCNKQKDSEKRAIGFKRAP